MVIKSKDRQHYNHRFNPKLLPYLKKIHYWCMNGKPVRNILCHNNTHNRDCQSRVLQVRRKGLVKGQEYIYAGKDLKERIVLGFTE